MQRRRVIDVLGEFNRPIFMCEREATCVSRCSCLQFQVGQHVAVTIATAALYNFRVHCICYTRLCHLSSDDIDDNPRVPQSWQLIKLPLTPMCLPAPMHRSHSTLLEHRNWTMNLSVVAAYTLNSSRRTAHATTIYRLCIQIRSIAGSVDCRKSPTSKGISSKDPLSARRQSEQVHLCTE